MLFNYVQIGTKDVNRLVDFYIKALDFKVSDDKEYLNGEEGVVLEAPGFKDNKVLFGFVKRTKGKAREINDRGYAHIAFETVDVEACVNRLVKYGGTFQSTLENPSKKPCVYCKDIDGNIVEFHIPFPSKDASVFETLVCLAHLKHDKGVRKELGHSNLKFIHVNMITEDYRKLLDSYNASFGSTDTGKIKDHSGTFKENVIGVKGVHVLGKHVLLPGFFKSYPTFEVFQYSIKGDDKVIGLDNLGINAIGFKSDNLEQDIELITKNGGRFVENINDNLVLVEDMQGSKIFLRK